MENLEMIIEKVKDHPVLYNYNVPCYKDRAVRQETWETIGKELKLSGEAVKATWEKLRRCFMNAIYRRRFRNNHRSQRLNQPWKYEDKMAFLLPFTEHRKPDSTVRDDEGIRQFSHQNEDGNQRLLPDIQEQDDSGQSFNDIMDEVSETFRPHSPVIIKREILTSPELFVKNEEELLENRIDSNTYTREYSGLNNFDTDNPRRDNNATQLSGCSKTSQINTKNSTDSFEISALKRKRSTLKATSNYSNDLYRNKALNLREISDFSECEIIPTRSVKRKLTEKSDMDETDMFFLSMSKMCKKLPDIVQSEIKMLLSNSIFQAQINQHKDTQRKQSLSQLESTSAVSLD